MHVTDPGVLENRLASVQAQVRIPRLLVRLVRLVRANSPDAPAQVLDSFNLTSDSLKKSNRIECLPELQALIKIRKLPFHSTVTSHFICLAVAYALSGSRTE